MHRDELKELSSILNYYFICSLAMGIASSSIAVTGGILLVRSDVGMPVSPKVMTAVIVVFVGALTGVLAFLVLLPAELKLIRRKAAARL